MLHRVISGGQTGADIAGLRAAKKLGIPTGGTAPEGYKTSAGRNPELKTKFGLKAHGGYAKRTRINVDDSDATLVILVHKGRGGSSKTVGYCHTKRWNQDMFEGCTGGGCYRKCLVIHGQERLEMDALEETAAEIQRFIVENDIRVLNVAGHRASSAFEKPFFERAPFDYEKRCQQLLELALDVVYCVLDFECCWDAPPSPKVEEIIEFPSVLWGVEEGVISEFHSFVAVEHMAGRRLLAETTRITGVTQENVDAAPSFAQVVAMHAEWLERVTPAGKRALLVTCGDFDAKMAARQATRDGVELGPFWASWCNVKKVFARFYGLRRPTGMAGMLAHLGMELVGKHHCGRDDTRNIASIVGRMVADGARLQATRVKGR